MRNVGGGIVIDGQQIRRHRPWSRDQPPLLSDDGRHITVKSEPGRGSTFTIRLPKYVEAPKGIA
jgi:hypothetical protein